MCLVLLAHRAFPEFPLILAANRDEYFARASAPASWWSHQGTAIFGGRDLEKGGTWLGITGTGRFAVVTNVREGTKPLQHGLASRGWLTRDALASDVLPPRIDRALFPSFNLLVGEGDSLHYLREDADAMRVEPGIHGLSNHRLDTPWPKVGRAMAVLDVTRGRVDAELLFRILADDAAAPDDDLPSTGVPLEIERALSPPFVRLPQVDYGTRCSTVIIGHAAGGFEFEERTFDSRGVLTGTVRERIG